MLRHLLIPKHLSKSKNDYFTFGVNDYFGYYESSCERLLKKLSQIARTRKINKIIAPAAKTKSGTTRIQDNVRITGPDVISGLRAYHRPYFTA